MAERIANVRAATEDDAEAVLALAERFATSFRVCEQSFRETFARLLSDKSGCILVAVEAGTVVGYLLGFDHDTFFANGRVAWVEEIMVEEAHRRCGTGRALMSAFELRSMERGGKLVALATRRASAFYEALGFEGSATYFRKLL